MGSAASPGSAGDRSDFTHRPRLSAGTCSSGTVMGRALLEGDTEPRTGGQTEAVGNVSGSSGGRGAPRPTRAQHRLGADPSPGWDRWAGAKSPRAGRWLWLQGLCQRHQSSGELGEIPHLIVHPRNSHQPSVGESTRAGTVGPEGHDLQMPK